MFAKRVSRDYLSSEIASFADFQNRTISQSKLVSVPNKKSEKPKNVLVSTNDEELWLPKQRRKLKRRRIDDSPNEEPIKRRSWLKLVAKKRHSHVVKATDLSFLPLLDLQFQELPLTAPLEEVSLLPLPLLPLPVQNVLVSNFNLDQCQTLNPPRPNQLHLLPETLPKYEDLELPPSSVKVDPLAVPLHGASERLLVPLQEDPPLPLLQLARPILLLQQGSVESGLLHVKPVSLHSIYSQ